MNSIDYGNNNNINNSNKNYTRYNSINNNNNHISTCTSTPSTGIVHTEILKKKISDLTNLYLKA